MILRVEFGLGKTSQFLKRSKNFLTTHFKLPPEDVINQGKKNIQMDHYVHRT